MGASTYGEDGLVEKPSIQLIESLGWRSSDCYDEMFGSGSSLGRETPAEVVLVSRLHPVLQKLNSELPPQAIEAAIEELTRDRSSLSPVNANREIYTMLKDGVPVVYRTEAGEQSGERVHVIDWETPLNNNFFLASQFWVSGDMYKRRADLIGFVNGLPIVFIELKAVHKRLKDAYDKNLTDYRDTIPQLFWYNAFIILSNGSESRIGSSTAEWEHFSDWK
jgi:type I restriction enzyme R subunit